MEWPVVISTGRALIQFISAIFENGLQQSNGHDMAYLSATEEVCKKATSVQMKRLDLGVPFGILGFSKMYLLNKVSLRNPFSIRCWHASALSI